MPGTQFLRHYGWQWAVMGGSTTFIATPSTKQHGG